MNHKVIRVDNLMYKGCELHWKCIRCGMCVPKHCWTKSNLKRRSARAKFRGRRSEVIKSGFLRFCNDPELACCKAERELEQLRDENATLHAELAESQRRERAAVEDLYHCENACDYCGNAYRCNRNVCNEVDPRTGECADKWQWRGPQETGKGEAE